MVAYGCPAPTPAVAANKIRIDYWWQVVVFFIAIAAEQPLLEIYRQRGSGRWTYAQS